jgi:competence protein ComEC
LRPPAAVRDDGAVEPASAAEALGLLGLLAPAGIFAGRAAGALHDLGLTRTLAGPTTIAAAVVLGVAIVAARRGTDRAVAACVLVAMVLVTAAGVLLRLDTFDRGLVPALVARGGKVELDARVAAEPRKGSLGWQTVLRVQSVDGVATRERVAAVLQSPPVLGDRLRIVASARPLPEGGYGRWLAQAHVVALLDVQDVRIVDGPGPLSRSSEYVRERIRTAATRHLTQATGGLLVGFVTGDTRLLPEDDSDAMQATGLSHLTAVSGSNTAILLAGIAGLLALLRVGAGSRWAVLVVTIPWFAFLTRLEPSVLRAGVMALLVIAATVHGVARDARHLLAGAVFLLVLVDPMLSWSLGLLLSACATLGVLVVAPVITRRIEGLLPRSAAQLVGITLGAQATVAPVLLMSFGTIEWISLPANLLAVPVAAIGATIAFVSSAVALVHVGAASSVFALAGPAAASVLWVARTGERFSGGPTLPESLLVRGASVVVPMVILVLVRMLRGRAKASQDPGVELSAAPADAPFSLTALETGQHTSSGSAVRTRRS